LFYVALPVHPVDNNMDILSLLNIKRNYY